MMITKQASFNIVVLGLAAQNWERAGHDRDGHFSCLYRDPMARKCGAGQLIAPEKYNKHMEGQCASDLANNWPDALPDIQGLTMAQTSDWLDTIQEAHDGSESATSMMERFKALGEKYDLSWPLYDSAP